MYTCIPWQQRRETYVMWKPGRSHDTKFWGKMEQNKATRSCHENAEGFETGSVTKVINEIDENSK